MSKRKRHQKGSLQIRKVGKRRVWLLFYYENGRRRCKTIGPVSRQFTKSQAEAAVQETLNDLNRRSLQLDGQPVTFMKYVMDTHKWEKSTAMTTQERIRVHLIAAFADRELRSLKRKELQEFPERKASSGLSFSYVDHLRWDIRSILRLAMEDGHIEHNPAGSINTPRQAVLNERKVVTREEVSKAIGALEFREALIVKLAVCCGMRPGEILGLKWGHVAEQYIEIRQGVYRGVIDTPKTRRSIRKIGLPPGIIADLASWRSISLRCGEDDWLFASERLTPISRDNLWRRAIRPRLEKIGLGWASFQVMRRTFSSLTREVGADRKVIADQMGHGIGVNMDEYTITKLEQLTAATAKLEAYLLEAAECPKTVM